MRRRSTGPQRTEAGPLAVGSAAHRAGPQLGPVRCEHQRSSKRDPTRRSRESFKHSSSTSVCAGTGSTLAAAAQAGPPLGVQATRPGGRRLRGPGRHTWSLSRGICPGSGNPRKQLLVKAKVDGGQPARERGPSRRPSISLVASPLRSPNTQEDHTGEGPGRGAGAWLEGLTALRDPAPATPLHFRPLLSSAADAGPSRPQGTRHSVSRSRAAPSLAGPPTQVTELGGRRQEALCQGRGGDLLAKGRRCPGERVPGRSLRALPARPAPGFSAGRRLWGRGNWVQCDGLFGGPQGGSPVLASRPRPHCCKALGQEGPRTLHLHPARCSSRTCLAQRWRFGPTPPPEDLGRRLAGAAGLRRGSSGFTNHISSLCAGSKQPVA